MCIGPYFYKQYIFFSHKNLTKLIIMQRLRVKNFLLLLRILCQLHMLNYEQYVCYFVCIVYVDPIWWLDKKFNQNFLNQKPKLKR